MFCGPQYTLRCNLVSIRLFGWLIRFRLPIRTLNRHCETQIRLLHVTSVELPKCGLFAGMLSLALVLGPWLSLRTKLQSLVLALALNLESLVLSLALRVESLVLALNFKSLVESFCHNRLADRLSATYDLSNFRPTRLATTGQKFASIQPLLSYVLCSPATSVPVERVFSQSGLLMRPNRARMSNSLLETLVFLKCNSSVCVWCCSMQHMTSLFSRIEHWRTVMSL